MSPPIGLGVWIAFIDRFRGGVAEAIDRCLAIGASWVAPRAGENGVFNCGFKLEHLAQYQAAGLQVFPWDFSRPSTWRQSINAFALLVDAGADGLIIDAEQSWDIDTNGPADAAQFMTALRAHPKLASAWIADAPWPYLGKHPTFPAAQFAYNGVDARLPQAYATEIGTTVPRCLFETDREWSLWESAHPYLIKPRWPILSTYSRASKVVVKDGLDALDRYGGQPVSLYSLDAPMDAALYAALVDRALRSRSKSTIPSPPPPPPDPRTANQVGGSTLADEAHAIAAAFSLDDDDELQATPTDPQVPSAIARRTSSSQRLPALKQQDTEPENDVADRNRRR